MPLGGLVSGGVSALGGLLGNLLGSGDKAQQQAALQAALSNIQGVNAPTAASLQVALQQYKDTGQMSPELEATIQQQQSGMNQVQADPNAVAAQQAALAKLTSASNGGLTPADAAALGQIQSQADQSEQGKEGSILQDMQQRGEGGSGNELAARLSSAQSSAEGQRQAGLNVAGQASQRALQAMSQMGSLGGQIQNENFGEAASKAQAQDAINKYNAMNSQQVAGQNTNIGNAAQQYNLQNTQNTSNMNTGVANQQNAMNAQANQTAYSDAMSKAQAEATAEGNMANYYGGQAAQTQSIGSGVGQGLGQGVSAMMNYGSPVGASTGTTSNSGSNYFNSPNPYSTGGSGLSYAHGGEIPGVATVEGDSEVNDTQPIEASPGEFVVSREMRKDPGKVKKTLEDLNKKESDEQHQQHVNNVIGHHVSVLSRLQKLEQAIAKMGK